jgi:hypothetical protein
MKRSLVLLSCIPVAAAIVVWFAAPGAVTPDADSIGVTLPDSTRDIFSSMNDQRLTIEEVPSSAYASQRAHQEKQARKQDPWQTLRMRVLTDAEMTEDLFARFCPSVLGC